MRLLAKLAIANGVACQVSYGGYDELLLAHASTCNVPLATGSGLCVCLHGWTCLRSKEIMVDQVNGRQSWRHSDEKPYQPPLRVQRLRLAV